MTERDGAAFDRQFAADKALIARIDERGEGLTDWEVGFIETCLEWIDAHKLLTDTMREKAEEIEEDRC